MRFISFVIFVVILGAIVAFAVQNQHEATLVFFKYHLTSSIALLVGAAYVLGMLSGWTVVGMLRRSFRRVAVIPEQR